MKRYKGLLVFVLMFASILFLGSTKCFAEDNMSKAPIHSYTFDTDTGSTVVDSGTGPAVSGVATGTSLVPGYNGTGYARHFDGNSYIKFSDKVTTIGPKSISFKIRKSEKPGTIQEYIMANVADTKSEYGITGLVWTDGSLAFEIVKAGRFYITSTNSICDNKWHSVLLTWDGTTNANTVKLFIDDMTTPNNTTTATFTESNLPTYAFQLGALSGFWGKKLIGDLDEFNVYDTFYVNPPAGVVATSDNNAQINISWNAVGGATSYNVYKSQNPDTGYEKIGTTTDTFYQDKDVQSGIRYYYKITAVQSGIESAFSDKASGTLGSPSVITGNRAILEITFINGKAKEYDLSASEIDAFINWYDGKSGGTGKSYFAIRKNSNVKPFLGRKEYIRFDTIESFEIKDYNE